MDYYRQRPDGVFDAFTLNAVKAFQQDHFLEEDGILGPESKIVLSQALQYFDMPQLNQSPETEDWGLTAEAPNEGNQP